VLSLKLLELLHRSKLSERLTSLARAAWTAGIGPNGVAGQASCQKMLVYAEKLSTLLAGRLHLKKVNIYKHLKAKPYNI